MSSPAESRKSEKSGKEENEEENREESLEEDKEEDRKEEEEGDKEEYKDENKEAATDAVPNDEEANAEDDEEEYYDEDEKPGSVHMPPDSGTTAWCVVLSCTVIRVCTIAIQGICAKGIREKIGKEENKRLLEILTVAETLALPVVGLLMTHYGYRIVCFCGCVLATVDLFALAWIPVDRYRAWFYAIYCLAEIGFTFINLTALVPMLEYFHKKRMIALFVYSVVTLLPTILFDVVLRKNEYNFAVSCTIFQLVAVTTAGIACSSVVPLTLDVEIGPKWINRFLGLEDLAFLKDKMLYFLFGFVFLFFLGEDFGNQSNFENQSNFGNQTNFVYPGIQKDVSVTILLLVPILGQLIGYIVAVYLWNRSDRVLFFVGGILILCSAVFTSTVAIDMNHFTSIWESICFGVLEIAYGFVTMSTQKVLPDIFGKQNTRMVASMVASMIALPKLIESLYMGLFDQNILARYIHAGFLILFAGVCALIFGKFFTSRVTLPIQNEGESTSAEDNQEKEVTVEVVSPRKSVTLCPDPESDSSY